MHGMHPTNHPCRQKGFILLSVVVTMVLLATIVFLLNYQGALDAGISRTHIEDLDGEYVVRAGMQHALWQLQQQGCGPYTDITDQPFAGHSYSATFTPNNAGGTVTTYTVAVSDDAWIKSDAPTQNYGGDAQLRTYFDFSPSTTQRTLYRFDVAAAGIPSGALVVSAVAKIFVLDSNSSASVTVHRINADWTESTVNWDSINASYDFSSIGSVPKGAAVGQYTSVNITSLVQGWINGSTANQGIMLKTGWIGDLAQFTSKEYSNIAQRPYLEVRISDGTLSNRADIDVTATLSSGASLSLQRKDVPLHQTPASTMTLQPDAAVGKDGWIEDSAQDPNYGISDRLLVNSSLRALLEFDLDTLPFGARIENATLELYNETNATGTVNLHRLTSAWVEGTCDGNPCAADGANWNTSDGSTLWSSAGGDIEPTAIATTSVTPNAWNGWDISNLIRGWVSGELVNNGLLLKSTDAGNIRFTSSDSPTTNQHPKLTITYTCECGVSCQTPAGSGNVLLVAGDALNLDPADAYKKALFESWGYVVSLIDDEDDQSAFDAALANNDVAYVSETVSDWRLADKLVSTSKGVVIEKGSQNDNLGISTSYGDDVGHSIEVVDNSHYITSLLPAGVSPVYTADMDGLYVAGTPAPGLQTLANFLGAPGLAVLEAGALLADGSSTAAGRRVMLPLGRNSQFNWD